MNSRKIVGCITIIALWLLLVLIIRRIGALP